MKWEDMNQSTLVGGPTPVDAKDPIPPSTRRAVSTKKPMVRRKNLYLRQRPTLLSRKLIFVGGCRRTDQLHWSGISYTHSTVNYQRGEYALDRDVNIDQCSTVSAPPNNSCVVQRVIKASGLVGEGLILFKECRNSHGHICPLCKLPKHDLRITSVYSFTSA